MEWMLMPLRRYAEFSGRSRRKEYWMFFLFSLILNLVASFIDVTLGLNTMIAGVYGPLSALLGLGMLVPSIAVGVRRLHDTNRSGWWLLLPVVPYALVIAGTANLSPGLTIVGALVALVAVIVLIVFLVMDGTSGPNRFGADPKGQVDAAVFS